METLIDFLLVVHIVNAILMAWPFYALVAVNQRARLGPPVGDRTDTYMENIIKNRSIPCFVFQATALITGLALAQLGGLGLESVATNPALTAKTVLLLMVAGILAYVHFRLQRKIDRLFTQAGGRPVPEEVARRIGALRLRRKRLASVCLFSVLTMAMLGVQVRTAFAGWLTALLILAIAAFAARAFKSTTPYGWA
ncbi:MAG: hypothetical protein V3U98_10850 [Acidobacteriota bacterium]